MLSVTPAAQDKLGELLTGRDGPESMIRVWVDPSNGHAP
jgi:Fe-S cluster assembly iron-binding protein IscA